MLRLALSVVVIVVGSSASLFAQAPIKVDGVVEQVVSQGIVAKSKDGKTKYAIGFDPASKINVTGKAGPDILKVGTYIQMDVKMNSKMEPAEDVSKIQIIEKNAMNPPGIASALGPDGKMGEAGPYFVRGNVKTNKNNELSVTAGSKTVTVRLKPGMTMDVNLSDWRLANPGDAIVGDGKTVGQPGAMTMVYGERIDIKSVMPIDPTKKKTLK
jgi:hypothetical protein